MLSQILAAALFIGVGLLFIDLVPLQENMMCESGSYGNASECPDAVFSQSYFEARGRFRAAAEAARAQLSSYIVVEEHGVAYTMDVALIVGGKKGALLVHVSGTHGVEGYIGSAIQTDLLRGWNASRADGPTTVFIHAVNPYGFAHSRRFNEHNVDLNRNCFFEASEWEEVKGRDPNLVGYETFKHLLAPQEVPSLIDRYLMLVRAAYNVVVYGFVPLKRTLVTGQYHHPEGVFYGGDKEEKSTSILKEVLSAFRGFEKVVVIDVHSGLGPEGVDTLMVRSEEHLDVARSVFPSPQFLSEAPVDGAGANAGYDLSRGAVNYHPILGTHAVAVTEEFGTVPGLFVARAVVLENAAYHHARGSYIHRVTMDWLRDAFYPQKMSFKKSVLRRGGAAFEAAWGYLVR